MRNCLSRFLAAALAAALPVGVQTAAADQIHAFARTSLMDEVFDFQRSLEDSGPTSAAKDDHFDMALGFISEHLSASGLAQFSTTRLLGASASAFGGFVEPLERATAIGNASWGDSQRLAGPKAPPDFLRMTFTLHGVFQQDQVVSQQDTSILGVVFSTPLNGGFNKTIVSASLADSEFTTSGFISPPNPVVTHPQDQVVQYEFTGTFDALARLTSQGTYDFNVALTATADTAGGFALSAGLNTLSLVAVTLPDGNTPESEGLVLTFDSGLLSPNASAVPEPTSLTLLSIGAACTIGYGWRSSRRSRIRC
jgi:hypothetical protein